MRVRDVIGIFFSSCFICINVFAQEITISGYVRDKVSNEPVPFANTWVKGTYNGIAVDMEGYFSLNINIGDTVCFSSVGYSPTEIVFKNSDNQPISVFLEEDIHSLDEVVIKPDEDFTKALVKKIIENKEQNAEKISGTSDYKTLSKTTVYFAIDPESDATHFIDTLNAHKVNDQNLIYMPIYLAEEACDVKEYYPKLLYSNKDGIFPKLNQTLESLIKQYLVVDMDFYRNQIYIFDRGFISPLSNNALLNYNIYFIDSTVVDNIKLYNLSFSPKNKFSPLFTGRFSVESESFALTRIMVYFKEEANVNFVNGFTGIVTYSKQQNGEMFLNKQQIDINLSLFNDNDSSNIFSLENSEDISVGDMLLNKTKYYSTASSLDPINASEWKDRDEFEFKELGGDDYKKVNQLQKQPVVKAIDAVGGIVLTGYINCPVMDIGPVFDIYSTNAVEGDRFTIPLRTGEQVFNHFTLGGFVGYGTKSNEFKYGANIGWQPFKNDRYVFRFSYADDYTLISQDKFLRFIKKNPNTRGNGNFIAALTTRERDPYIKEEKNIHFRIEYNADKNFDLEVSPYYMLNYSTPEVHFIRNGREYFNYQNYGVLINFRLAFRQHFDRLYFARIYYLTQIPVVNLTMDVGQVKLPDDDSDVLGFYSHFHGSIQGMYNLGPIGMRYMVNGGYLFGNAPYDMLDMPVGSQSLGFAKYRYNLLYQATFANNLYTNAHLDFNGGGIILNKVPLIRRLKLREIISLKCHYGIRNNSYEGVFDMPGYYYNEISYPYAEVGVGITNILKVIRVEYVRQAGNYYKMENIADKQGIRFRAELSF